MPTDTTTTPVVPPADAAGWRALHGDDLAAAMLAVRWYVREDTVLGRWYVMPIAVSPFTGVPAVGTFIAEQIARDITDRHNTLVDLAARLAETRAQIQPRLDLLDRLRKLVQPGDVVHVPPKADMTITTGHHILVDQVNSYQVSGPRIRADGTPIRSRSVEQVRPDGYLQGGADWSLVAKATVLRNGETIYRPEGEQ